MSRPFLCTGWPWRCSTPFVCGAAALIVARPGQQDDPEIRPGSPLPRSARGVAGGPPVVVHHGIGLTTGSRIVRDRDQFTCPFPELMFSAWRPAVGFPQVLGTFANALLQQGAAWVRLSAWFEGCHNPYGHCALRGSAPSCSGGARTPTRNDEGRRPELLGPSPFNGGRMP